MLWVWIVARHVRIRNIMVTVEEERICGYSGNEGNIRTPADPPGIMECELTGFKKLFFSIEMMKLFALMDRVT